MAASARAFAERLDERSDAFKIAVLDGLSRHPKRLPCRWFYDARGSGLFERITTLAEYYPTRTEIGLLEQYASEIAAMAGPGVALVEFGSGSSRKTRPVIDALQDVRAYVPIDISDDALIEACTRLGRLYPDLTLLPVHADFNALATLPNAIEGTPRLGFFPGSTIGNFERSAAAGFLARAGKMLGPGSAFVIGVDLKKDPEILRRAYNDREGVTAAFNKNLLVRINRELGGDFDLAGFAHDAVYDETAGRIEMYLVSLGPQTVRIAGRAVRFAAEERIHTESSHKYAVEEFSALAESAGWGSERVWVDPDRLFSLHFLRNR